MTLKILLTVRRKPTQKMILMFKILNGSKVYKRQKKMCLILEQYRDEITKFEDFVETTCDALNNYGLVFRVKL